MQNSRRKFIQNASLVLAGASLKPSVLWSKNDTIAKVKNLIGIQLYSVRADMGKNPLGTLTELAKMGYEHVEHANYINRKFYGWTATEFKKVLDSLGLHMPSGHTVMDLNHFDKAKNDFTDAWKYTIDDAATLGQTYVISPSIDSKVRKSFDAFMFQVELFNKCGELCKKQGMKFGYHNHDFEFKEKVNGELIGIDYREAAPASASRDMYLDASGNPIVEKSLYGQLAAGVPGSVAGMEEAHLKYGKLKCLNPKD